MTVPPNSSQPMSRQPLGPPARLRLVALSVTAIEGLVAGDSNAASAELGLSLSDFVAVESTWLWRIRLSQVRGDPQALDWIARLAVVEDDVVGLAGFHGPPDDAGMVEVGYSVDPAFRRQGYAREMLGLLLQRAGEESAVTTVRATISPDNTASLATIAGFGFVEVGQQEDEEDGLEIIYEVAV